MKGNETKIPSVQNQKGKLNIQNIPYVKDLEEKHNSETDVPQKLVKSTVPGKFPISIKKIKTKIIKLKRTIKTEMKEIKRIKHGM